MLERKIKSQGRPDVLKSRGLGSMIGERMRVGQERKKIWREMSRLMVRL